MKHGATLLLVMLIAIFSILGQIVLTPEVEAQTVNETITPTVTLTPSTATQSSQEIVVTGILILITLEPPTPTPSDTPTQTPTSTPTMTPRPTPTETSTPTPTPTPGPVGQFVSSPYGIIPIVTLFILIMLASVFRLAGINIFDYVSRYWHPEVNANAVEVESDDSTNIVVSLGEEFNKRVWLERSEYKELTNYIDNISSGNIALAGPRGIGKTTLMNAIRKDEAFESYVTLGIATPTRYDEKEFLLNLFDGLCRSVLERIRKEPSLEKLAFEHDEDLVFSRSTRVRPILLIFGLGALVIVLQQLTDVAAQLDALLGYGSGGSSTVLGFVVLGLFIFSVLSLLYVFKPIFSLSLIEQIRLREPSLSKLYALTEEHLERIGYQQTFQSSRGAELNLSTLLRIGSTFGRSLTRQPYTLVNLVAEYREYTELIGHQFGKVLICIDELDKVLDAEQAREFLRKIKGVFSIEHTYYLVSVSEEALEAFRLRNVMGKDEVDSTFTTVIRLSSLSLKESIDLLRKRGMQITRYNKVIAVLSGGIPRDLIRLARKLHLSQQSNPKISEFIKIMIVEIVAEVTDNIRHNREFNYQAKLLMSELTQIIQTYGPTQIGTVLLNQLHGRINRSPQNEELSQIVLKLGIRLEIMGYLAEHLRIFKDIKLCEEFQNALSLVPLSPYEAQQEFYRLQVTRK